MYKLCTQYKKTGKIPEMGRRLGRPIKGILINEERIIKEAYEKYRVCASRLCKLVEKDYKVHIPLYTIHKILLKLGYAKPNGRIDVRKKK